MNLMVKVYGHGMLVADIVPAEFTDILWQPVPSVSRNTMIVP